MNKSGTLFIVCAPSGAGKTTLVDALIASMPLHYNLSRVITYTSRALRVGEKSGVDYHFISDLEFQAKIDQGFFLEWSTVYGTYYGTPRPILNDIDQGNSKILIIDRYGGQQLYHNKIKAIFIWISVPSIETLKNRLEARATESSDKITRRLELALCEMNQVANESFFDYHLCNDIFDKTLHKLTKIVQKNINFLNKKNRQKSLLKPHQFKL